MIINSTQTLQDVKDEFIAQTSEDKILDSDIRRAMDWLYSIVGRAIMQFAPETYRIKSGVQVVSSTGFDVSTLPNIANIRNRFEVYIDAVKPENYIPLKNPDNEERGYYLTGNILFLNPAELTDGKNQNVVFLYQRKTDRTDKSVALEDAPLLLDQDLELDVQEFITSVFYDGQFQFDRKQEAEDRFLGELQRYLTPPNRLRFLNIRV